MEQRNRMERRILGFLTAGHAVLREAAVAGKVLLETDDRGAISVAGDVVEELVRGGVLARAGERISLSKAGAGGAGPAPASRRDLGVVTVEHDGIYADAIVNLSESPLAQLVRRKDRNGVPFLSGAEFRAGERLRADYTRGQLVPRLGANWVASVSSGRRDGGNGIADLTDAALGARLRVENALAAVGPELSGVLVDVCCFLKGLELVETERGWPVRSAKIVLKTALAVLSRHYEPPARKSPPKRVLHWGSEDYRPRIDG